MPDQRLSALLAAALLLGLGQPAPASANGTQPAAAEASHGRYYGGVDWRTAKHVTVEMMEWGYRPRELRLTLGQPYRLTLINYGSYNHYFNAAEFLRTVDARKAVVERHAEIRAPYFTAFEVFRRGGTVDVYFIPKQAGTFAVHCHLADHRERGVHGTIVVKE